MSDYVEKNTKYILEKLREMQVALDKMSPEELRRIDAGTKDDSYVLYSTLERFILSGDDSISAKHTIIAKKDLKDLSYYQGECRNAEYALWVDNLGKFIYMREKFGDIFPETINHPEDYDEYDLFLPFREVSHWGEVPEKNRISKKELCKITGDCPHSFFNEDTQAQVTPEMIQLVEDNFPTDAYGDIMTFEAWPLRLLFQQAMVMGAWLEKNRDKELTKEFRLCDLEDDEIYAYIPEPGMGNLLNRTGSKWHSEDWSKYYNVDKMRFKKVVLED